MMPHRIMETPMSNANTRQFRSGMAIKWLLALVMGLGIVAGVFLLWRVSHQYRHHNHQQRSTSLAGTAAATGPAASAASQQAATAPTSPRTLLDLVRRQHVSYAATQPIGEELPFADALHVVLQDKVYLDSLHNLWITRQDADDTPTVLKRAASENTHITRELVVYAHWTVERGKSKAYLICQSAGRDKPPSQFLAPPLNELVDGSQRQTIGSAERIYDWDRAISVNGRIIVPTDAGASVFTIAVGDKEKTDKIEEAPSPVLADGPHGPSQITQDLRGLLMWIAPQGDQAGGKGVARYVDGRWQRLGPDARWPGDIIHLAPLVDGSIVQILRDLTVDPETPDGVRVDPDKVSVRLVPLDGGEVDQKKVAALIEQLSDDDQRKRDAASEALAALPPSIWPILEKALDGQAPDAQVRLRRVMKSHAVPTLGEMRLLDGRLKVVARQRDGSVLGYADAGVAIPRGEDEPELLAHAWLSLRPGEAVQLLPDRMVANLTPGSSRLAVTGSDWVISDDAGGPRWFTGNDFVPMTPKVQRAFSELYGRDVEGRWLLRKPGDAESVLVIDQHLPDLTPRLPVWSINCHGGQVGWDGKNYPVMKRGGSFALEQGSWRQLGDGEKMYTEAGDLPPSTPPPPIGGGGASPAATTRAFIHPSSLATNQADLGTSVLIDRQGTCYYGGQAALHVVYADGRSLRWELPDRALGTGRVTLIQDQDGRLFLFNEPGRVVRISATPSAAEPFAVDAVFSRGIPNTDDPRRIWLDPAGRIVIAYDGDKLAILFPAGLIPKSTFELIPDAELEKPEQ